MLNPGAWDWSNFAGFFWGGICFLCIIYTYFRVPEPTGRSFAEMDMLFEQGISARKFAEAEVDVFAESLNDELVASYRRRLNAGSRSLEEKSTTTGQVSL